jgi:hypothetical protein
MTGAEASGPYGHHDGGGFMVPFEDRIQDAKLLCLDVGEKAWAQE